AGQVEHERGLRSTRREEPLRGEVEATALAAADQREQEGLGVVFENREPAVVAVCAYGRDEVDLAQAARTMRGPAVDQYATLREFVGEPLGKHVLLRDLRSVAVRASL